MIDNDNKKEWTDNQSGLERAIDDVFGQVFSASLRCPRCNGRAEIEPESWPLDNKSKRVLRCFECSFEQEDLNKLKRGK